MQHIRVWLKKYWPTITVAALAIVLIFEAQYFIDSIQKFYSQGELRPVYHHRDDAKTPAAPAPAASIVPAKKSATELLAVRDIQLWMTFDYINVVFHLPQNYIKDILGINDASYPNIRLDTYAKRTNIDPQVLLNTVRQYITLYKNR